MAERISVREFWHDHKREILMGVGTSVVTALWHSYRVSTAYGKGFFAGQENATRLIHESKSPKLLD